MRLFSHQRAARPTRLLLACTLSLGLAACGGGESSDALVGQAKASMAQGDIKAAVIQLKNAVAADEKNAEARYQLGRLYLMADDPASAEKELKRAREAGYSARAVNPMIARALLGQREFQRVLDELPVPPDDDPDVATLQALRATAELGLDRREDARQSIERALQAGPDNPDVHLVLAQLALADGDADKAMQALDQALRIDPRHRDSLLLKADLLRATGKPAEAAAVYGEVLRDAPRNAHARLALAGIAIAGNQLADARREVDTVLKATPNNLQARYTQALIDFAEKQTEAARDHLASVLKAAPNYAPALLLGGAIEYSLGNLQSAEMHLNKVVKAVPSNLYARRLLAASQLRLGRPDDAARTLAPALDSADPDTGALAIAGEIALARKNFAQAAAYFEQAARRTPESAAIRTELGIARLAQGDSRAMADLQAAADMEGAGSRADTFLILTYLRQKQFDAALAAIAALEEKQGISPLTWNYRGAAHLGKQDPARARDSFGQALKLDPTFFPAAANLAQLDLHDKQPAVARQRFEGILKAEPGHLNAMLALADLAQRHKDEKTYAGWLEKAAQAHPQALQPRVALARHLLARGENNKALAMAREAVNLQPDSPLALDVLGSTQFALGDTANAIGSYRKWVELSANPAVPLTRLAAVQVRAKQIAEARRSLQDALRAQPDLLAAQLALGGLEIQGARYDDALKIARLIQQQKPKSAAGPLLEGDIALARRQFDSALSAYERAHRLEPAGALLIRQHAALEGLGRAEEGEKRLAAWLDSRPQEAAIRMALAERLLKRKQHAAAAEHYLQLNRSNPGNVVVLNNLAWALFEAGDTRAATYAEQAQKLRPDNPAVLDTYGWILANSGKPAQGLPHLRKAQAAAPDKADIQWHVAYALYLAGDHKRALLELDSLLGSGASFGDIDAARTLRTRLSKHPS